MTYENLVGSDEDRFRVEEDPKNPGEYHFFVGKTPVHYHLQRGVLEDLADASWGNGELERKLDLLNPEMTFSLITMIAKREFDWLDVSLALGAAVGNAERKYREYLEAQKGKESEKVEWPG